MLGRASKDMVYNKMGKKKYASMPTPFQTVKHIAKTDIQGLKNLSGKALSGFQNVMAKADKSVRKRFGLPYGH